MHDLYETVAEITVEPCSKDEPDVKAFFKVSDTLISNGMCKDDMYIVPASTNVIITYQQFYYFELCVDFFFT